MDQEMQKSTTSVLLVAFFLISIGACGHLVDDAKIISDSVVDFSNWQAVYVKPNELATWKLLGRGHVSKMINGQLYLAESVDSYGLMLISPTYYQGDAVVKYKLLSLTPASVFVTMLCIRDTSEQALTVPADCEGNLGFLMGQTKS